MNLGTTIIKSRHSVRSFKKTPIDESIIEEALDCAHLAPTAVNRQPWLFGCITSKEILEEIAALTDHGTFIAGAAACFAIFGEKNETYYLEDCSAATENLILTLQGYGIGSCWVAGDKKAYAEQVRKLLGVPDQYTLVSLVPAGFPMDVTIARKKDIEAITFRERYTQPDTV
jgi:nitroreductase